MAVPGFASGLRAYGAAPALTFAHGSISYAELAGRVDRLAARMGAARKLVAIEAALSSHAIAAYLAALKAGHVALLAPAGDPTAWQSLVERFRPELLFRRVDGRWRIEEPEDCSGEMLHAELALILATSGSTGVGKAVRLAGSAVAANASAISQYLQLRPDDRGALLLPIHYSYGLSVLNSHLAVGGSLFVTEGSILETGFLKLLRTQRCTNLAGVPYSYDLLEAVGFREQVFPDLRFMTVAGGRLAEDMVRRYHGHLAAHGKHFFVMYGQTEATARIAYVPPAIVGARPACIGVAIPGGELGLIDDAGLAIAAPDTEGELVYRGPNVMMGYADGRADLARGAEIDLLRTGDMAVREADGLYRITGRRRRMSKIAGVRIGHDALEASLARAGIAAAVVGDDHGVLAACTSPCPPDRVARPPRRGVRPAAEPGPGGRGRRAAAPGHRQDRLRGAARLARRRRRQTAIGSASRVPTDLLAPAGGKRRQLRHARRQFVALPRALDAARPSPRSHAARLGPDGHCRSRRPAADRRTPERGRERHCHSGDGGSDDPGPSCHRLAGCLRVPPP